MAAAGAVGAVVAGAELSAIAASENFLAKVPVKRENKSEETETPIGQEQCAAFDEERCRNDRGDESPSGCG